MRLSVPKKIGILAGLIVLITALFVWFIIKPEYQTLDIKEQEYNKLKLDLDAKKKITQDLKKIQARLEKLKRELEVMNAQLPDKKEIPGLLKTISSVGKEAGLKFQLFRPRTEISKDFYAEIPVEIQVVGSYHEVANFFYKVGMLDRIVNITNVNMGNPVEENGEIKLKTSCLATTFRFIEDPIQGGESPDKKNKKKRGDSY
ncbi:MAG: type 4a pilus biogenesis protein PilO [Deltaproteobacteria bacterium]|nr:type 4a pilus biogenesis protein PilO [Deltaproteobacteria bacterium]